MVIKPEIDLLLEKVGSKYTLCTVSAKRARQINDMVHGVRDKGMLTMSSSQIASLTSTKPLTLSLQEIADGDVSFEQISEKPKKKRKTKKKK